MEERTAQRLLLWLVGWTLYKMVTTHHHHPVQAQQLMDRVLGVYTSGKHGRKSSLKAALVIKWGPQHHTQYMASCWIGGYSNSLCIKFCFKKRSPKAALVVSGGLPGHTILCELDAREGVGGGQETKRDGGWKTKEMHMCKSLPLFVVL